ncbi:hypothetical protein J8M21_20825 [Pseudoalteromonas luteoviolacea]|uniref:hypothetical protein n=1 Tax=Pseudoalteromonas luteoviolacea TaxID=43657 RepID=UPI001B39D135|nr:hypothetical protein [Pseudoalteromonas luteoviolacea]MBQ4879666.1 hypothetical protein [Pseudoalteromonas luteoviolacea]MBQ4908660.1 hypothetical protein [Pseudoalteromonas luteoviolacea]
MERNSGDFFVMLTTQAGDYTPLVNSENEPDIARFETKEAAEAGAQNSVLGSAFGFEVFEIGCGL